MTVLYTIHLAWYLEVNYNQEQKCRISFSDADRDIALSFGCPHMATWKSDNRIIYLKTSLFQGQMREESGTRQMGGREIDFLERERSRWATQRTGMIWEARFF